MSVEVLVSQHFPEMFFLSIGILGAFSPKQRAWFLRRDEFRCQDPDCHDRVRPDGKGLHVHHILPQGFWEAQFGQEQLGEEAESPHQPWNGITLGGACHHNSYIGVHPDYAKALDVYREGDKESFKKVAKNHGGMADDGEIYWDPKKDLLYHGIATDRTEDYLLEHSDDPFPLK